PAARGGPGAPALAHVLRLRARRGHSTRGDFAVGDPGAARALGLRGEPGGCARGRPRRRARGLPRPREPAGGARLDAALAYSRGLESRRASLPIEIDGTVFKVDDLALQRDLGEL